MRVLLIGVGFMGLAMTQMIHGYPVAEFFCADIKPFNLSVATECGAMETLQIGSDEGNERLHQLGTGYFDVVIECTGTQEGLDLAVDMCGMAGAMYLFGWHRSPRKLDFKLGHLRGQRLVHTSPAIDTGRLYERYWPLTIDLVKSGVFNMKLLMTHRYEVTDIQTCMKDSTIRADGFIKSVFYFWRIEELDEGIFEINPVFRHLYGN